MNACDVLAGATALAARISGVRVFEKYCREDVTSLVEASLDDLMRGVLATLLESGEPIAPTRGSASEVRGVRLELTNPRARLSRSKTRGKLFSCLGELCWYLSGSRDVSPVAFYVPRYGADAEPDGTVNGAYGSRLFNFDGANQVQEVINTLRARPDSRQALIQMFDHQDLAGGFRHVPCTCTIQMFLRGGQLHAVTYMRSNDAFLGLPHDVFAFTMLQELIARSLEAEPGTYVHMVGSLHLYDDNAAAAAEFLDEGWSSPTAMPPMPDGDPWASTQQLVAVEAALRSGQPLDLSALPDPYWADLARLLAAYSAQKYRRDPTAIAEIRRSMNDRAYDVFLNDRFDVLE